MNLTRRELLEMTALLAVTAPRQARGALRLSKGAPASARTNDDITSLEETARRAAETIRAYSAEGHHRTATAVDRASAEALLASARAIGASASLEPFDLSRVDPAAAFVQMGGQRIDGLPMFDGAFTGAGGVRGRIGPINSDLPIAWTRIAPNAEAALRKMRDGSRHRAIVAVTMGGKPGLCPVNAGWFSEPFGPPVLQVSSEHLAAFEALTGSDFEVRLVSDVQRHRTQAFNVVSEIKGAKPELPPVCVMTPRSGWHANASERGGGLACWLETMRAVVAARGPAAGLRAVRIGQASPELRRAQAERRREAGLYPGRDGARVRGDGERGLLRTVKFVASSGHELGHLGLHDYLRRNVTLARDAFAWVHLGANIGTSTGDTGMTPSDDRLRDAALHAFVPHGLDKIRQSPSTQVNGEAATISEAGGRFISFIGANAWFHNPRDLWPDTVDVQAVARFARAVSDLTLALANTPA